MTSTSVSNSTWSSNQASDARLAVFTDLDGTLLDHATYSFDDARPALTHLKRAGIPLVLCTSKTRAEVEPLRALLENDAPFIVENGGGVFIPKDYFPFELDAKAGTRVERRADYLVLPIGAPYQELVAALARASFESGIRVRGFADMTDQAVASATGLPIDEARRARQREFDEPFTVIDSAGTDALLAAVTRQGKRWTAGGRFHHITGGDKGMAVQVLTGLYRRHLGALTTVGLGDAPNDAELLRAVDIPIIVSSPVAETLARLVPNARVTGAPGPVGWNEAVLQLLGVSG